MNACRDFCRGVQPRKGKIPSNGGEKGNQNSIYLKKW